MHHARPMSAFTRPLLAGVALTLLAPTPTRAGELPWADTFDATAGYRARQAEYLSACARATSATTGNYYSNLCVLATGEGALNVASIDGALAKINAREDTSDFRMTALLRMMALYGDSPLLPADVKARVEAAILDFKYWLDEPGPDDLCWWSENHQILFHAAEMVAGQLYPDHVFSNSGMTGREHVEHARPLIQRWLFERSRFGFSEWHSQVYWNEDIPALMNVIDFAEDEELATRAAIVMDLMTFDFANNLYRGKLVVPFGRTYPDHLLGGLDDSTEEASYILLGQGGYPGLASFSGSHVGTSPRYYPPPILEAIAVEAAPRHTHKQRDGVDVADGPDWGISYNDYADVVFWWGMGAYATSPVVYWTLQTVEHYDLWDDFFWSDVPFLQPLVGVWATIPITRYFDDLSRGSALEEMYTYTHRTPHYQLSGAQNYEVGLWAAQAHFWRAALDEQAYVFTTAPGGLPDDYAYSDWTGGWTPQGLFHENVGLIRYSRDAYRILDDALFVDYTHAYFPRSAFDEVRQEGRWTFGRSGDAWVGLYSQQPPTWATGETADYELIAEGKDNVWIVELGSIEEQPSFDAFVAGLAGTSVSVGLTSIEYDSPSQGLMVAQTRGSLTVDGRPIDVGPYARWDNPYCYQEAGDPITVIERGGERLTLDFEGPSRSVARTQARQAAFTRGSATARDPG